VSEDQALHICNFSPKLK